MIQLPNKRKGLLHLTPLFGTIVFGVMYIVATLLYPGGSQADKNSIGFSWTDNYWCNLLNENAINGQSNPAKPVAMTAMCILCLALSLFWVLFPIHLAINKKLKTAIQLSGVLGMSMACLLPTALNHDMVINLAFLFGSVALVGTFIGIYKSRWFALFVFGILNILLVGLNNYVYYTKGMIIYLPLIQKISFAAFLTWICCIDIQLFRLAKIKR